MQQAGDSTQEECQSAWSGSGTTTSSSSASSGGIARWFPNGFHTQTIDWSALEEHLEQVPDFAFETTTTSNCLRQGMPKGMPLGVTALHLTVSCGLAPLSLIQRLIDVNPEALTQVEAQHGWNVLHCALKFNRNIKLEEDDDDNQTIVDLLLQARPELVYDGATSIDDYGLPPLGYAQDPGIVKRLVKLMSPKLVGSVLKKIFLSRKLFGGSVEAMQHVIKELSLVELQQNRPILAPAIMPEKLLRKQSLIKYVLIQTSKCGRHSAERTDLTRLIDPIVQSQFRFHFQIEDVVSNSSPPAVECLKALRAKSKLGPKVLALYLSVINDNAEYTENLEYMEEPDLEGRTPPPPDSTVDVTDFPSHNEPTTTTGFNPHINRLLYCKEELDAKIEQSLDALRQAQVSLENFKASYSSTVEKLCSDATTTRAGAERAATSNQEEETRLVLASSSSSSSAPTPPKRQKSLDNGDPLLAPQRGGRVAATIQDTIENMKAASTTLDKYSQKVSVDAETLLRQQEDLRTVDLAFFRNTNHDQVVHAMEHMARHQLEKVGLQKCLDEIKGQLKEAEAMEDDNKKERQEDLNLRWATVSGEMREVMRKMEDLRELITRRRQDLGGHMIKARRLLKGGGPANKMVRLRAARFLRLAKQEMKELMASLVATSPSYKPMRRGRRKKLRQQQQQQEQQRGSSKTVEEDEELNRMTKRMKLG